MKTTAATAMGLALLSATQVTLAQSGNTFPLHGTLRDFRRTDTNFAVAPVGGNGLFQGNVALSLGGDARPLFVGGGGKVDIHWMDQDGHSIAPSMLLEAGGGSGTIMLMYAPRICNDACMDTYDPAMGAYGGENVGPAPIIETGAAMPVISEPVLNSPITSMPKPAAKNQPVILSSDLLTGSLCIQNNTRVEVQGHVTIMCNGEFMLKNSARIDLADGASLTVYARQGMRIENSARLNAAGRSRDVRLYNMGCKEVMMQNDAMACAEIVSPKAMLRMKNEAQLFGQVTARMLEMSNEAALHIEAGSNICGREPADVAGTYSRLSDGGIPSPAAFSTWFSDVPASNVSRPHTITLNKAANGVMWQYASGVFYPMDGLGFGNQGQIHNNYFTFSTKIRFTHRACTGTYFEVISTDDAWLFVDGELAMDKGGMRMPGIPQYVELDRLGLTDGETYEMHLFIAQRNTAASAIRIRTRAELIDATGH